MELYSKTLVNMTVAAIMCRFIWDMWDWDPIKKLAEILRYKPMGSLDQPGITYLTVLNQIIKDNPTKSEKNK